VQDEPDRELLRRFAHGDREAFEVLFRQFEREVYRWIFRILREPDAAEDALVEAFWRAYRGRARFDPSRSFGAWMRRIATHCAIDRLNAIRRRDRREIAGRVPPHSAPAGRGPSRELTMSNGPADPALADHIRRAFAALPPKLRVVATLALIEELPQTAIADALGVPIGTVKSRLFRATRELRTELIRVGIQA
jgi:RNA polymerase sigma-70 factor (ECF subfamily)